MHSLYDTRRWPRPRDIILSDTTLTPDERQRELARRDAHFAAPHEISTTDMPLVLPKQVSVKKRRHRKSPTAGERSKAVLRVLRKAELPMTARDIARHVGCLPSQAATACVSLRQDGHVTDCGQLLWSAVR